MPDLSVKLDHLRQRLAERVLRHLPGPRLTVRTKTPLVSFTFDDVPDTAWRAGAAILERHGLRGTFYIAGGLLDRREPDRTLISAEGCRALAKAGHEIGCHTFSHRDVSTLSRAELVADLEQNGQLLDSLCGADAGRNFAYPYNRGSIANRATFAARYPTCRAGGDRINRGRVSRSFLYGMEIRQPEEDARALTAQIDAVVDNPGWLIFFTHDITEKPTPYGCTPATFSLLVEHALARNCRILPVREALNHLREEQA